MRRVKICLISFLTVFGINFAYAQKKQALEIVTKGTSALEEQAVRGVTKTGGLTTGVLPKVQVPTATTLKNSISNTPSSLTASVKSKIAEEEAKLRALNGAANGGGIFPPDEDKLVEDWPEDMFPSVPDRMFTLQQLLDLYEPTWEQLLTEYLSAEEIDAVKEAISETDKLFFAIENEKVIFINKDNWNYRDIFSQKLDEVCAQRGLTLTTKQRRFLLGGLGSSWHHPFLNNHLKLVTLETFIAKEGTVPVSKPKTLGESIIAENRLYSDIQNLKIIKVNALVRQAAFRLYRENDHSRKISPRMSLEEKIKQLEQFQAQYGRNPSKKAPAGSEEYKLASKINNDINRKDPADPQVKAIRELYDKFRTRGMSAEQLKISLEAYIVTHDGEFPASGTSLYHRIQYAANPTGTRAQQEIVRILKENREQQKVRKEDLAQKQTLLNLLENGFPAYGTPLYRQFRKYADPKGTPVQQGLFLLYRDEQIQRTEQTAKKTLLKILKQEEFPKSGTSLYKMIYQLADPNGTPSQRELSYLMKDKNKKFSQKYAAAAKQVWKEVLENGFPEYGTSLYRQVYHYANSKGTVFEQGLNRLLKERRHQQTDQRARETLLWILKNGWPQTSTAEYRSLNYYADSKGTTAQQILFRLLVTRNK